MVLPQIRGRDPAAFDGATSGTIVLAPTAQQIADERTKEILFPAQDLIYNAQYFASQLPTHRCAAQGRALCRPRRGGR